MNKRRLLYALIPIMERGFNLQEIRILQLVFEKKMNISEISRELKIDYKNAHRYANKLKDAGLITLSSTKPSQGKKIEIALSEKTLQEVLDELEATLLRKEDYEEVAKLISESRRKLRYVKLIDENK